MVYIQYQWKWLKIANILAIAIAIGYEINIVLNVEREQISFW